jgi:hypothetical protein
VGPHCRSDGKTIGIGLYKDENCNEYNADLTDISSYTGLDVSDDYLKFFYSDNCISCLASVSRTRVSAVLYYTFRREISLSISTLSGWIRAGRKRRRRSNGSLWDVV